MAVAIFPSYTLKRVKEIFSAPEQGKSNEIFAILATLIVLLSACSSNNLSGIRLSSKRSTLLPRQ
jgi:hypothetical protein